MEGALEKIPSSDTVALKLRNIQGKINFLEDTTHHILDAFNCVSRITNGLRFTRVLQLTLKHLEKDLAHQETKLVALGNAHVNFRCHIERLINVSWSVEQATAFEAELEHLSKAIEEQSHLLMQDFL